MHGVTKEITLPVTYTGSIKDPRGSERAGFELATTLNRQEYGVKFNKTLDNGSLMLSDDVAVTISLETVKKAPDAARSQRSDRSHPEGPARGPKDPMTQPDCPETAQTAAPHGIPCLAQDDRARPDPDTRRRSRPETLELHA